MKHGCTAFSEKRFERVKNGFASVLKRVRDRTSVSKVSARLTITRSCEVLELATALVRSETRRDEVTMADRRTRAVRCAQWSDRLVATVSLLGILNSGRIVAADTGGDFR